MEQIVHYIEDLQFACFALVFGIMAVLSRQDRTIRFVWCSYALATLVSIVDVTIPHPYSPFTNSLILAVLSLRYAVLAAGLVYFLRCTRWPAALSMCIAAGTLCAVALSKLHVPGPVLLAMDYVLLAVQQLLLATLVLRGREASTRVPRLLLAFLFLLSTAYRLNQMHFVLSRRTPHDLWLRDVGLFVNGTVLSGILPFAIVWMMNARDNAYLLQQNLLDPLTELMNRRGLADAVSRELARYRRARQDFAFAIVDIDHFKSLNDTHGHAFGDEVLKIVATMLRSVVRQTDVVARTGGEEFVLLLPLTGGEDMMPMLDRVRTVIQQRDIVTWDDVSVSVTISIGATNTAGRLEPTWEGLQKEADLALYAAKRAGRNRVERHDVENAHGLASLRGEAEEVDYGSAGALPVS